MFKSVILAVAIGFAALPLVAQDDPEQVIRQQIEAFQGDDFAAAFQYASPMIQRQFGDPETFGRMVREGYPMVWRPDAITFLGVTSHAGALFQKLMIRDQGGRLHILEYEMVPGENSWRINGVRYLGAPQMGA